MPQKTRPRWFLKEWRQYRGLTQARLGERIGKSKSNISEFENGVTRYNQDLLEALADALACEPADLIMRNPMQPDGIWSIWDRIPETKREDARRILETLAAPPKRKQG
jgi:transcriptional regulator with XRE-family HTH domain